MVIVAVDWICELAMIMAIDWRYWVMRIVKWLVWKEVSCLVLLLIVVIWSFYCLLLWLKKEEMIVSKKKKEMIANWNYWIGVNACESMSGWEIEDLIR